MCFDETHGSNYPRFAKWTELQAHIKTEHPPTCPYPICHVGRSWLNVSALLLTKSPAETCLPVEPESQGAPQGSHRSRSQSQPGNCSGTDAFISKQHFRGHDDESQQLWSRTQAKAETRIRFSRSGQSGSGRYADTSEEAQADFERYREGLAVSSAGLRQDVQDGS